MVPSGKSFRSTVQSYGNFPVRTISDVRDMHNGWCQSLLSTGEMLAKDRRDGWTVRSPLAGQGTSPGEEKAR